jgi:mannose-6-phosphate isomerase-like protein (cupin superfamily)
MKKGTLLTIFCMVLFSLGGLGQDMQSIDTINPPASYENIYSRPLYSDSLVSSFVIFIKKEVRQHVHVTHTEQVFILEGEGEMTLGKKKFSVKKGDMVFIPKGTGHSLKVTSKMPVKVLSIQAPNFDGKDRVMIENIETK